MNYAVISQSEKEAYDVFLSTVMRLSPIKVNMKLKKIIFDGDVYSFMGKNHFDEFIKKDFIGEQLSDYYFYQKWVE